LLTNRIRPSTKGQACEPLPQSRGDASRYSRGWRPRRAHRGPQPSRNGQDCSAVDQAATAHAARPGGRPVVGRSHRSHDHRRDRTVRRSCARPTAGRRNDHSATTLRGAARPPRHRRAPHRPDEADLCAGCAEQRARGQRFLRLPMVGPGRRRRSRCARQFIGNRCAAGRVGRGTAGSRPGRPGNCPAGCSRDRWTGLSAGGRVRDGGGDATPREHTCAASRNGRSRKTSSATASLGQAMRANSSMKGNRYEYAPRPTSGVDR
jgi:hypothetical protein